MPTLLASVFLHVLLWEGSLGVAMMRITLRGGRFGEAGAILGK
jgi:hypothetical protein